ncbi:glycosyltransferase family 2 protein [bacterium]|nr:glycosyltransferase family 2 protein [bacterium]
MSAVVVSRQGGDVLVECLASLLGQTYPRLEVILVDNSDDGAHAGAMRARHGERLRIIANRRNEGFAGGCNRGIRAARGEWILLLNDDAVADPDLVAALMAVAGARPDVGMLACRVVSYEFPHLIDSAGLLLYPDGICRSRGWEEKDLGQYDQEADVLAPNGCAAGYRASMLRETGLFDEAYFMYLEDLDLGMRGRLAGWGCRYVPAARVRHRGSFTTGPHSRRKAFLVERNRIWNAVKFLPGFLLLVSPLFTLNRYLLQLYAAATRQGLAGKFARDYSYAQGATTIAAAYLAAAWHLPPMWRARRHIQRRSALSKRQLYELISRFKLDAIELALK